MAPSRKEMRRKTLNKEGKERKATKIFRFIQTSLFFSCLNMLHLLPCFLLMSSFAFVFYPRLFFWCLLYFVSIYRLTLIQKFITSTFTLNFIAFHEQIEVGREENLYADALFHFPSFQRFIFLVSVFIYICINFPCPARKSLG